MARESKVVDRAVQELYGLPPSEFTRARDARARELRKAGDRDAADAVKALRKPTVAAWALNQLARERSKDVDRLLGAGQKLRAAQEQLLGGGERSALQDAAAAERELVAKLAGDAVALARDAGERPGAGFEEKVAGTLHAAALDQETAEQLRAGRLVREREAIGGFGAGAFGPGGPDAPGPDAGGPDAGADDASGRGASGPGAGAAPARATAARGRSPSRAKSGSKPADRPSGADRPTRARAPAASDEARRRERLAAARTDERHARRELEAAAKARESADTRAQAAEAHAREATARAKTTAERLADAKRAESAARKAHTRAARALDKAEQGSAQRS
ncbi:MAG: hypothetical protein QOE69_2064 [Thermoleophilaceae bacterium]|nr:hypothetical protein [Thermoleophilaceae bacterium]